MGSRKLRIVSLLVLLAAALALTGLIAPGASAQVFTATFTVDPTDALKNQVISSTPLSSGGDKVQVHVTATEGSTQGLTVTLNFREGSGLASTTDITGNIESTNADGYATFSNLKIGDPNEPTLTDYQFEAVVSAPILTIGAALAADAPFSEPFDIWDAGCKGTDVSGCSIELRGGLDTYKSTGTVILTASSLAQGDLPNLECPGQKLIFAGDIFSHGTSGTGAVFVTSHITAADFRAVGTNFGQAHVEWCVGLEPGSPGLDNGGIYEQQDTNDDGTLDLYVGTAPRCPKKKNASTFAPCIVSQVSDRLGGSITKGWLEGGDPPRRT